MNRGWKGAATFFGLWLVLTASLFPAVRLVIDGMAPAMFTPARIFGRVQMGVALALVLGLFWFWKESPKRFFGRGDGRATGWRLFVWGGVGFGMVAAAAWLQCLLGVRGWAGLPGPGIWAGAFFTGILVSLLEEFFFRGVLGLAFWRAVGEKPASWLIAMNAAVFSVAHFLRPQGEIGQHWFSGFAAWASLELWAGPANPWKLAGLFVAGMILARLVWQRQNLWTAVGLHAGWVAGLQICDRLWKESPQVSGGWWGPSLETGPIPFLLLLLVAFALWGRPVHARVD